MAFSYACSERLASVDMEHLSMQLDDSRSETQPVPSRDVLVARVGELEGRVEFLEAALKDALNELSRILVEDLAHA